MEATLFLCALITLVVCAAALFCGIVGGLFVYQYGIKLREYKPQAFLISDINAGGFKIRQNKQGEYELIENVEAEADDGDFIVSEEEYEEWMGAAPRM